LSFPSRELILQVVKDQKKKSLAVRGIPQEDANHSINLFTQPESLDINLHESLRILRDWVNQTSYKQISHKTKPEDSEI
jgi:hypothetical protein